MYLIYDDEDDIVEIAMEYLDYAGIPVVGTTNRDIFMQLVNAEFESLKGVLFDLSFLSNQDLKALKNMKTPTYCITGALLPEGFEGIEKPFHPEDLIKLVG
jgi:DNA-binding NtrC family response regulator